MKQSVPQPAQQRPPSSLQPETKNLRHQNHIKTEDPETQ